MFLVGAGAVSYSPNQCALLLFLFLEEQASGDKASRHSDMRLPVHSPAKLGLPEPVATCITNAGVMLAILQPAKRGRSSACSTAVCLKVHALARPCFLGHTSISNFNASMGSSQSTVVGGFVVMVQAQAVRSFFVPRFFEGTIRSCRDWDMGPWLPDPSTPVFPNCCSAWRSKRCTG
jgi:hypothetical protein